MAVIVPVLDEAHRLAPCLDGLLAQGAGSWRDPDRRRRLDRSTRVTWCESTRAATDACAWSKPVLLRAAGTAKSGASHNGEQALRSSAEWVLTLDADVHAAAGARPLARRARKRTPPAPAQCGDRATSLGRRRRFTPPGAAGDAGVSLRPSRRMHAVSQRRRGQWPVLPDPPRPAARSSVDSRYVRDSLCEDVTLARLAARSGDAVGFYEADGLIDVAMYADWRDAWHNWPRSLAARDALFGAAGWLGLLEVLLVQALPLPLLLIGWPVGAPRRLNLLLLAVRARNAGRDGARLSVQTMDLLVLTSARSTSRAGPVAQRAASAPHVARPHLRTPERNDCRRMRLARALLRRTCRRARLRSGWHADRPAPSRSCGQPARSVNKLSPSACSTPARCTWCWAPRRCWRSAAPHSAGAARCCFSPGVRPVARIRADRDRHAAIPSAITSTPAVWATRSSGACPSRSRCPGSTWAWRHSCWVARWRAGIPSGAWRSARIF